jgi:hypothetical protein
MGSSKPQEHGMNACETSLSLMASKSVKSILLSLLKLLQMICLYAKFMLMISYLGLLTNLLVKSLVNDGGVEVFLRISSQATLRGHHHQPNEVHSRHTYKVWNEGRQTHQDTHGNQWASRPRHGR